MSGCRLHANEESITPTPTTMPRIKNMIGFRQEWERNGIALLQSGSWVVPSFDEAEFGVTTALDFSKFSFAAEDSVVVTQGTKGKLVRFAKISADGQFAQYPFRKYLRLSHINATVFSKADFVAELQAQPSLEVAKATDGSRYIGALWGERDAAYKSLLYLRDEQLRWLDLEENPPPQASSQKVRIVSENPQGGPSVKLRMLELYPSKNLKA